MIPKIIQINKGDNCDEIVSRFSQEYNIDLAHRIVIRPEKTELTIAQIHLMQQDIKVAFSKKILVVLFAVDDSSNEVQNSLLKCLEEEAERIQFLLLVRNPLRLLSTVVSRCSINEFKQTSTLLTDAVNDDYATFFSLQTNTDATQEDAVRKIDHFLQNFPFKNHRILRYILQIRKFIMDNNMNPALALDSILLFLTKTSTMN